MIIKKKSSHPTVSLIFGEAQQVASSQSAAEKLPQILRKASPSESIARPEESLGQPSSVAAREPENANAREIVQLTAVTQDNPPLTAEGLHSIPATPSKADVSATSLDSAVPPSSDPSSVTPHHASVEALSHKSSWLASWTRTKVEWVPDASLEKTPRPTLAPGSGTEPSPSLETAHRQTASVWYQPPVPSITGDPQLVVESNPIPALPQDIPTTPQFGNLPTPPPGSASYSSSPAGQPAHNYASTPSPLHEDLLKLSPSKLPLATSSTVLQSSDAPNSIQPPTNRFIFGIPLLGRTKVPIEKTVAATQSDDIRTMSLPADQPPPSKQPLETQVSAPLAVERPSAPIAETTNVNITADTLVQPEGATDKGTVGAIEVTNTQTRMWWSYLGWTSAQPPNPQKSESLEQTESVTVPDEVPDSTKLLAIPDAPLPPVGEIAAQTVETPQKLPGDTEDQAAPALSTHTSEPQAFAWYAPWSWSQGSATPEVPQGSHPDSQVTGEDNVPSELTREHVAPEPQAPEANPISSTITNNRSGWSSFFSARAVAMKSITNESHKEEMEVMDLDEDEAPTTGSPSSALNSTPLNKDIHTKPSSPTQADKSIPAGGSVNVSDTVRRGATKRPPSPTPSKKSGVKTPLFPPPPNQVLPTWEDIFHTQPRTHVPTQPPSALSKTFQYVSDVLFARDEPAASKKGKGREKSLGPYEMALPRSWEVVGEQEQRNVLQGYQRAVVIGVHGWFPGAVMRTVLGGPTGTSSKFVNMAVQALADFQENHNVKLSKITKIPLEGEGTISRRVDKLYQNLIGNQEWVDDLRNADVIFFATHSQGSIVSTHILDRLIADGHIRTTARDLGVAAVAIASGSANMMRAPQRVCCLALCGIHLGPLRYLSTSPLAQPYIQYFESTAARELFEFQNTESQISKDYVKALRNVLDNGVKMVYIASLNDQVVGLYSGLFTSATHPLILRALYIDGDVYHSSDFLSNLLVLLLRIRNAGLSDGGLLTHLSEATAGSLNGVGHSTAYEETATYSFAINYLFLSDNGQQQSQIELMVEPFDARSEQNDYEIPWALRDLIADDRVAELFSEDFIRLRDAFREWQPKTAILRDIKRKLQPIQRLSSTLLSKHVDSTSKL